MSDVFSRAHDQQVTQVEQASTNVDNRSIDAKLQDEARLFWGSRNHVGEGVREQIQHYRENPQELQKAVGTGILLGAAFALASRSPSRAIQIAAKYVAPPLLLGHCAYTMTGDSVAKVWSDHAALPTEQHKMGLRLGAGAVDTAVMLPAGMIGAGSTIGLERLGARMQHRVTTPETAPELVLRSATDGARNSEILPTWDKGIKVKGIAEPATGKGDSWVQIYREAFPPEEADSVYAIRQRLTDGGSKLYETRGTDGRVLTFSLFDRLGEVEIGGEMRPVFLNSYNATRAGYRGMGLGSKHMGSSLSQLFQEHPNAVVPFEIDHTGLRTLPTLTEVQAALRSGDYSKLGPRNSAIELTPEMARTNLERLQFYERLGERTGHPSRVANVDYMMPNLDDEAAAALPAHLLYFADRPLPSGAVTDVVRTIFTSPTGYELPATHPVIEQVLSTVGKTKISAKLPD